MEWYYSQDGEQRGPVSQERFEQLARAGTIGATTLVWREGFPNWKPYSELPGESRPVFSMDSTGLVACVECGMRLPERETVRFENAHVCASCKPIYLQRIREGVPRSGNAMVWRSGRELVTPRDVTFPQRCMKCNEPAEGAPLKRSLYWHSPWLYIALLANILIYVILASMLRKTGVAFVSLCPAHRAARRKLIALSWIAGLGGLFLIGEGLTINSDQGIWIFLGGIVVSLAAVFFGMSRARLILPKKIDENRMFLKGCGEPFLASFPEWPGTA